MNCPHCKVELWVFDGGSWTWYSCNTLKCPNYQEYLKLEDLE